MEILRKYRLISTFFVLVVFLSFSGYTVQSSLVRESHHITGNLIFTSIQACSGEYLSSNFDRLNPVHLMNIVKFFPERTNDQESGNLGLSRSGRYSFNSVTGSPRDNLLSRICKFQI